MTKKSTVEQKRQRNNHNPDNEKDTTNNVKNEASENEMDPPDDGNKPESLAGEEIVSEEENVPLSEFEALQDEYNQLHEKYLRLAAEFENYQKRTARDVQRRIEFANEELLRDILPLLDDLERTLTAAEDDSSEAQLKEGINLVYNNFLNTLKRRGVEPIKSVGQEFNPELHEAVMMQESDEYDSNQIMNEFERGYQRGDKVLRHAKVVVNK